MNIRSKEHQLLAQRHKKPQGGNVKLTLPNIQKMNLGEEDSIRLQKRKKNTNDIKKNFENLLVENEPSLPFIKKRIKQGDKFLEQIAFNAINDQVNGLRRKDAVINPGKDNKLYDFSQRKIEGFSKSNVSSVFKEEILTLNRKKSLNYLTNVKTGENSVKFESGEEDEEFNEISTFNQKSLKIKDSNKVNSFQKRAVKSEIQIENSDFNSQMDFNADLKSSDGIKRVKFKEAEERNSIEEKNQLDDSKKLELESISKLFKKDDSIINFTDSFISKELSSVNSKIFNPILRHLTTNISDSYSFSIDKILHSFDNISFKNFDTGFQVKMRLFPEELGELELHIRKEGQNISMVAFVMNEEAKQVMMKNTENLSNYLMNQGYNLNQIMVEVKNENQQKSFDNFDRILAENRNFITGNIDFNQNNNKNTINISRISKYKGLGRFVNKYV